MAPRCASGKGGEQWYLCSLEGGQSVGVWTPVSSRLPAQGMHAAWGPAHPEVPWGQKPHLNPPGLAGGGTLAVPRQLLAASPGLRTMGPVRSCCLALLWSF